MLNVRAEEPGIGSGVLLRALEPLEGINQMEMHRKTGKLMDLARGPGRLAAALQIDQRLDGVDLCADGPLWLATAVRKTADTDTSVRIGITPEVGCCASLRWAIPSLAAQRPSRQNKKPFSLSRFESSSLGSSPKIPIGGYKCVEAECPI